MGLILREFNILGMKTSDNEVGQSHYCRRPHPLPYFKRLTINEIINSFSAKSIGEKQVLFGFDFLTSQSQNYNLIEKNCCFSWLMTYIQM